MKISRKHLREMILQEVGLLPKSMSDYAQRDRARSFARDRESKRDEFLTTSGLGSAEVVMSDGASIPFDVFIIDHGTEHDDPGAVVRFPTGEEVSLSSVMQLVHIAAKYMGV